MLVTQCLKAVFIVVDITLFFDVRQLLSRSLVTEIITLEKALVIKRSWDTSIIEKASHENLPNTIVPHIEI